MRLLPAAALAAITAVILAVTLQPVPSQAGHVWLLCVFCGERATADVIANVVLFIPFGAALAWVAPRSRGAWRLGLALSLAVELSQRFLAGRDASISDVITNTLGTLVGWALWRYATGGARRPAPAAWPLAALGFAAAIATTSWLLQPATTDATYYGMWTPLLGQFEWYRGRVLDARLNTAPLPARPLQDPGPLRAFARGHGALAVRLAAGPPTTALAPLVAVFDGDKREILVLGADRSDVVLRYRRRAASWGLDEPDLRFEGAALSWKPGDTLSITVTRTPAGACLTTAGPPVCVDATSGRGWSLVLYPERFPEWLRSALDVLWLAGLALLAGWCAGAPAAGGLVGLTMLATLVAAPWVGGFATPPGQIAGAVAGLVTGLWLRSLARRRA
jgi:hypothetical protein